ncbi:MAG: hypothetical protein NZZ41_03540 [Candidatus Dojkabacteria bacterium]|nr:hypothetical protein [Candidatus Dojkabacteria bacterium]
MNKYALLFLSVIVFVLFMLSTHNVFAQSYTNMKSYDFSTDVQDGIVGLTAMIFYTCCCCILLIPWLYICYWVYVDSKKLNVENSILWVLLTLFTGIVGLLIYLLAIRPEAKNRLRDMYTRQSGSTDSPTNS